VSSGVTAGLFPGQGSQTGDLRSQVARDAPELLDLCVELVGEDPFACVAQSTRFAQPAIFCASVAGWMRLREHVRPVALAGHSLGELSALVAAEALDPVDGLVLAVRRGELMAGAGDGDEGMLALLGAGEDLPARLAEDHDVVVANDNAPGQVVLAGRLERLHEARDAARAQGARAIMLDVAGAFHSPAMASAVAPFRAALEQVQLREPVVPVICGWNARPFDDVREELAAAIVAPVRWRSTMLALAALGAEQFVDLGPGSVLAKLVRRNLPEARVIDPDELAAPVAVGAGDGA
jgi:[acyl-carrier-protein] S-malonyltransferase